MASKILQNILFVAIIVSIATQGASGSPAATSATIPGIDCATVLCLLPECEDDEKLVVPDGKCCPECQPVEEPDCSAVSCLRPDCEEGQVLVVPDGECCPECQTIECEIEGSTPSNCASLCPPTCDNSGQIFCPAVCVTGCVCPPGEVIDTVNKKCVPRDECPQTEDPCALLDCMSNAVCKVDPGTGTAFCEPSCDLDNGGCSDNQLCKLNVVQCVTTPCPPEIVCVDFDIVCAQDPDPGPCEALFRKFFYNSTSDQCELFIYGGCEGNDNRFDTRSDCISSCGADNPCIGVTCDQGSTCKVDDQTGLAFCEPSCDLDNGGCRDDQICELQNVQCVTAPCPPVVNCIDITPCALVLCPDGHQCEVFQPTGEAFCTPNCSLNNGGCDKDQICELQTVQCIRAPCPPVVNCINKDPCATVRCANGYRCKVFKPTGEAFCDPDCDLNNGGCPAKQDCRLQTVICVRAPCPPIIECVNRSDKACPSTCSKEFCSQKKNRRAMCSNPGPREIPGCTGSCQLTYCHACYYHDNSDDSRSDDESSNPAHCSGCDNHQDYLSNSRCFRRWANCVRRSQWMRNQSGDDLRCYNPPCPLRG